MSLRIFLSVFEEALRRAWPAVGFDLRIGAVSFIVEFDQHIEQGGIRMNFSGARGEQREIDAA